MTNPFVLGGNDLSVAWRTLRDSLAALTDEEKLKKVAEFFAHTPLGRLSCDPDDPDTWGDAWEMISQNDWCPVRVAVGMEATLRLGGMEAGRLVLEWGIDREESLQEMLLIVDNSYALNRDIGEVLPKPNRQIMMRWSYQGHGYGLDSD